MFIFALSFVLNSILFAVMLKGCCWKHRRTILLIQFIFLCETFAYVSNPHYSDTWYFFDKINALLLAVYAIGCGREKHFLMIGTCLGFEGLLQLIPWADADLNFLYVATTATYFRQVLDLLLTIFLTWAIWHYDVTEVTNEQAQP